ncbi:hypothetical protein Daesc_006881 [Daldinia eschscholtzii]|uniref:Spo12-like protein n=1 Tax=Daldinia eschscholtzii TaxID=292717 RepID=A0AAX6MIQ9_9PEZI
MGAPLATKDANVSVQTQDAAAMDNGKPTSTQTLEYHRQVLHKKMEEEKYGANVTNTANSTSVTVTVTSVDAAIPHAKNPQYRRLANSDITNGRQQQYVSPSDDIMSPCTAKLSALKGRAVGKAKPKSLFAQTSAKKFDGKNIFGSSKAVVPPAGSRSGI